MELARGNIRELHRWLQDGMAQEMDTVMVRREGVIDLKDLHGCIGTEDWQLFMAEHPLDGHDFEALSPRWLYEILLAIDKGRLPARPVVFEGVRNLDTIDISSMLEDKEILQALHFARRKINWESAGEDSLLSKERRNTLAEEIKLNLIRLCKDEWGVSVARD